MQQPVASLFEGSRAEFSRLTFSNSFGAGMYCENSTVHVWRCTFVGGTYFDGTALLLSNSTFTVRASRIHRNQAVNLGGAAVLVHSTGSIENTIIANNYSANSDYLVGGIFLSASWVSIVHSVIADNLGAGVEALDSTVFLRNSIVWSNTCNMPAEFSCVQDGQPGPGVISQDPLLTVTYHLQWNSPCINAGSNGWLLPFDMDHEPRPQNVFVDMGADEWLSSAGDRVPDWWKLIWGLDLNSASVWQQDPNGDGVLNLDHYRLNTTPINTNVLRIIGASNSVVRALKGLTNRVVVVLGTNALAGFVCLTNNAPGSIFITVGTTGAFTWTPSLDQIGIWSNISFIAWDAVSAVTSPTVITVLQTNRAPMLTPIGDKLCGEGQVLQFLVTASDQDGDSLTLVCSTQSVPGATFHPLVNGTSIFTWIPSFSAAGIYSNVFFAAFDGELWDHEYVTISVTNSPAPPTHTALVINNGARYTNAAPVTLSLTASNAAFMAIAFSEAALTNWMPFVPVTNWPLATLNGTNYLFARFMTAWLDESTNVASWIIGDSLPPVCTPLFPPNGYIATSQVVLSWSASDAGGSGIARYLLQTNSGFVSVTTTTFAAGVPYLTNWWRVMAYDWAGNTSTWTELRWYLIPEPSCACNFFLIIMAYLSRLPRPSHS
ncbi:MAG: right-handed parallel beta-helix repeat-containing protein [bacterium]|nr:right-handed parallel beta-helix repeat-containing protein [bacterium]